jgi:hypothetical protein
MTVLALKPLSHATALPVIISAMTTVNALTL